VPRTWKYDWEAIRSYYDLGHTPTESQREFSVSNGAWYRAVQRGTIVPRQMNGGASRGRTRAEVSELLDQGLSQAAIARVLGVSKSTVCFHARKLGLVARAEPARRYDWDEIRAFYEQGHSAAECQRRFGFSLAAWADAIRRGAISTRPRLEPLELVLAAGKRRSRRHVKTRILLAGLKPEHCEICGLPGWEGRPISLELHHVNGDSADNRLENLRLLCPNCHSQTENFGSRNKRATAAVPR
jgi:hypothetical protein